MSQQQQDPGQQQQGQENSDTLADLRRAADDGVKARRELAFVKAGIDTDSPLGQMFAKSYEGDLTKEAITEEWGKIAPAPAPAPEPQAQENVEPQGQPDPAALEAQQQAHDRARRGIASTPAEPVPEQTVDPLKKGYEQFHQNLADGVGREAAAKPVFEGIIGAAVAGDKRFIWDGSWTDEEMAEGRTSRA